MNILLAANSNLIGGGNRSLLGLALELRRRGYTVVVACPGVGPMWDECRRQGFACHLSTLAYPDASAPFASAQDGWRWAALLRRERIDLVHANGSESLRPLATPASLLGLPLVCHCRFPESAHRVRWSYRKVPKPDVLIFNSQSLQEEMRVVYAEVCPRSEQIAIYNALDLDQFVPRSKSLGSPPRVGIIANLMPIKGHDVFLAMARQLIDRGFRAEFWIIGEEHEPGYRRVLEQAARSFDAAGQVRFLGFRPRVAELIPDLDVVVCSSRVEPFGRCLIEAMACARAVVATRVGGIPEVVAEGVTGLLVEPDDAAALVDAVAALLEDEPRRLDLGRAGRSRVEARFSLRAHGDAILDVYERLLRGRGRGAAPTPDHAGPAAS